ncbi:DUF2855 family protein [Blastococcus litoris]|uniref:DUF2855 family protein n=1 Tax=Blastococcus litoris TaxID=2171622 RepID=UPI000E30AFFE|nr:DUF2855 family protein [Blastococcus litoris]
MGDSGRNSWTLAVDRSDLARTRRLATPVPDPAPGEAVLRVQRVGLTANNVTYAVLGDSFRYWEFFPTEPGWGVVPLWGFAEVAESRVDGLAEGTRVYGYLPFGSHLLVRPGRVGERGFRDTSDHRATLPSPYNAYAATTGHPAYEADREDLQVLFRPLFFTSFMLADWLDDSDAMGAERIVLSSASSKTAYGTAFELHRLGREVVGLTSPRNVAYTEGLGCYDAVLPYDALDQLSPDVPTLYADLAGDPALTARVRVQLGSSLLHEVVVGVTHQDAATAGTLADTGPAMFFAPDQMRKRIGEWGREGLDSRFADAWRAFAPLADQWVDVVVSAGPDELERVWQDVLAGRADPRTGHVITF